MPAAMNVLGRRFGRYQVLGNGYRGHSAKRHWLCLCDCGTFVSVEVGSLRRGRSRSCGCLQREVVAVAARKHGMANSVEYQAWKGMKRRVTNPRFKNFKYYGGRGITICPEWLHSFETFYRDMGSCPPSHTLDRTDNNQGYSKANCRWTTMDVQVENRRTTRRVVLNGEFVTIRKASEATGLKFPTIASRLRSGWPPELILTVQPRNGWSPKKRHSRTSQGEQNTLSIQEGSHGRG